MGVNDARIIRNEGAEILLYQTENGEIRIETRLENDTIWLTQPHMADLYQTTQQNISQHIQNIYEEGELSPDATHKKFLSVRQDGQRQVQRNNRAAINQNLKKNCMRKATIKQFLIVQTAPIKVAIGK